MMHLLDVITRKKLHKKTTNNHIHTTTTTHNTKSKNNNNSTNNKNNNNSYNQSTVHLLSMYKLNMPSVTMLLLLMVESGHG